MVRVLKPDTEADVADAIRDAARAQSPLAIEGGGTKRHLGRTVDAPAILKLSGLAGITMYEPDEMVFTARAGTPLAEIEATLASKGQCLAFEPASPEGATIAGVVAANASGPRRFAAGAPRDHLLGFSAVDGQGERFKAGGRVVKNVTGYDLPKLAAGSFGTLFVMTELTLRAVPRGARAVLAVDDLPPAKALDLLRRIAGSPFDPAGLAYVATRALTLIRLEGRPDGVAARSDELRRTLAKGARVLTPDDGASLFKSLTDVQPLFGKATEVWRLSLPPTQTEEAIKQLVPETWVADWGGGLLWLEEPSGAVHATAHALGGHATLFRQRVPRDDIFPPLDAATDALTRRLKQTFDPARILNRGRMYKDI